MREMDSRKRQNLRNGRQQEGKRQVREHERADQPPCKGYHRYGCATADGAAFDHRGRDKNRGEGKRGPGGGQ